MRSIQRCALAACGPDVAHAPDLLQVQVAVPVGQDVGDGGLARAAADDQVWVALQQEAFVADGQAAPGQQHRRAVHRGDLVEQPDHQVVLAEVRRDTEDVHVARGDALEDVLQGDAELHVHQLDATQQDGAGGAGQVGDGRREPGQREELRVVQRGQ
ncbi:hypothetical protein [Saccharothrix sp. ALI-22-I]|uniref:hypothetical protein n=1 Tax=Saccharothrix sp. ALI-22-I TaxID=1933778 RepID=UPI001EE77FB6|nr:hypothetical protein [Saccharothrix sp. ALI-22-I]